MYISLYDTMVREMIVGSKAKACKENDILALTKSDILFTLGQELAYWEKLLK